MAGGKGERFWPVSTPECPKQFLSLVGDGTLVQQTVTRLARMLPLQDIYVVTSAAHVELARSQLPQLPAANFIVEPEGRDTAACVGLASVWLEKLYPDAITLVVSADHYIANPVRFCDAAQTAMEHAAQSGGLVALGIQPTRAETAYGYIELGDLCSTGKTVPVYRARRFVEKPDATRAAEFVRSGRFLWNGGMFAWTLKTIREEIQRYLPELHQGLEQLAACRTLEDMRASLPEVFSRLPTVSVDYGIMEHSSKVYVVMSDFEWDDLGSWAALARYQGVDSNGNVMIGDVVAEDCRNIVVRSTGRLVTLLGVKDLIVAETEDAILVCARDRVQHIRQLLAKVRAR